MNDQLSVQYMRILHVIPFFTPALGGSIIVLGFLSKELAKNGHHVTIITTDYRFDLEYAKSIEEAGVKVLPFRSSFNIGLFIYSPTMKTWIENNLQHFDVVHLHNYRSYQNNVAAQYAMKYRVPCIMQPDNSMPRTVTKQTSKWLYDVLYGKKLLQATTKLLAISKQEAEFCARNGMDTKKITQIYMGIDFDAACGLSPKPGDFKAKYHINERMILFLGRLHKSKGIDTVVEAFFRLTKETNDVMLVIVGSDEGYRKRLEKLIERLGIENHVKFIGYVDHLDKLCAYADAELFVHTVKYMGGVGLTPLEAIMCGTPVVVTKECGEIVQEADCGYIVEYGDIEDLKNKMMRLLEDPHEGELMVHRGKQYISRNLSWSTIAQKVETIYEDCIRNI